MNNLCLCEWGNSDTGDLGVNLVFYYYFLLANEYVL